MKKTLPLFLAILLLLSYGFSSCSLIGVKDLDKNDTITIKVPTGRCLVTTITENGKAVANAKYNLKGQLEELLTFGENGAIGRSSIIYDLDGLVINIATFAPNASNSTDDFYYNSRKQLIKHEKKFPNATASSYSLFRSNLIYGANDLLFRVYEEITPVNGWIGPPKYFKEYVYDANNRLIEIKEIIDKVTNIPSSLHGTTASVEYYEYDSQGNCIVKYEERMYPYKFNKRKSWAIEYDYTRPNYFQDWIWEQFEYFKNFKMTHFPKRSINYKEDGSVDEISDIVITEENEKGYPSKITIQNNKSNGLRVIRNLTIAYNCF